MKAQFRAVRLNMDKPLCIVITVCVTDSVNKDITRTLPVIRDKCSGCTKSTSEMLLEELLLLSCYFLLLFICKQYICVSLYIIFYTSGRVKISYGRLQTFFCNFQVFWKPTVLLYWFLSYFSSVRQTL